MAKDYTKTLNLPTTDFPMRASLPQREPGFLENWEKNHIYEKSLERNRGKEPFILHDGPPFSNGNIHMGTAMNKVLKDFVLKYKTMTGHYAPYIPGWDNHGMPIESAIIKKNKLDRKKMSIPEFRSACHAFAQDFVNIQRNQFRALGVLGDWEHPYLTMNPSFEAREIRVFGEMFKKGYIYKGLKPVYWCPHDETALAEAEIDYKDVDCTSIYVKFRVADDKGKLAGICPLDKTYFIIWTTTPWTLPGNLAIALHPQDSYVVVKTDRDEYYIVADALCDVTMQAGGVESFERIASFPGRDFEYMTARHPFLDRDSLVVNADYVTMDSGTGCVHTAPGFGADDYQTGRRYKMEIVVPVDDRGYQTEDAGPYAGMYYEKSNTVIVDDMKESGALFASAKVSHSYPHCWRCKNPIIFRATPQWFCSVEAFRDEAAKACEGVEWMPAWGGERITQMVRDRADWCISRQRHWGLPIPVFYCADCGEVICDEKTIEAVADRFGKEGSNAWFEHSEEELLPAGYTCPKCGGKHFIKETDTLDGWFDSGSSHFSVLRDNPEMFWPADLYLEGADQYRGWFQSSLLTAVGTTGKAPYKAVLTHGWVVDGEGKAMHKSLGNSVLAEDVVKQYGADMLRLWVASSDYRVDVRVSDAIFKQLSDAYRKIRNTARILLADLGTKEDDFDPDRDMVAFDKLYDVDKWLLSRLNGLVRTVRRAYDDYEFHIIYHEIYNFCTTELSKLYIDITKDRMYAERKDSPARRAAQTTMYVVLDSLVRMLAPLLAYTSDEIWQAMNHRACDNAEHVILNDMPDACDELSFPEIEAHYENLFRIRDDVMKALEGARADKKIGKSLDANVTIYAEGDDYAILDSFRAELATLFIVSGVTLENGKAPQGVEIGENGLGVVVSEASGIRCDRCWIYSDDCETLDDGEGGETHLCHRCREVAEQA